MKFTLHVVIEDDEGRREEEDIITLEKSTGPADLAGLSLEESKRVLHSFQTCMVQQQAEDYTRTHRCCPECQKKRRSKGQTTIHYRTVFGMVALLNQRLYHCRCSHNNTQTFSILNEWLPEHHSPELQYLETKWASLMSYGLTVELLKDVLPIHTTLHASTVRNHLHATAKRQDKLVQGQPDYLEGCPREWGQLPKPEKPLTMGIDGGYVRDWHQKHTNFEVIVGKSFSTTQATKRLGFVQTLEDNPRRRVMHVLSKQGMQANQQVTFLSDGADNVRDLQYRMYPESEHVLDWFHLTMKLTVLNQFAKGLTQSDPDIGPTIATLLQSTKWYLWHGNATRALETLEECDALLWDEDLLYNNRKRFEKHVDELMTYIQNNASLIPNYGEKWRYGEPISTAFVESTVNEVVAKRMVKKQQMQWTHAGAHALLQTRTAVLNEELRGQFEAWYPAMAA